MAACWPILWPVLFPDPDPGPDGDSREGRCADPSDVQAHGGLGEGVLGGTVAEDTPVLTDSRIS